MSGNPASMSPEERKKFMEAKKKAMEERKKVWEPELAKDGYIKEEDRNNPYNLPPFILWNGMNLHGARLKNSFMGLSPVEKCEAIRSLPVRDDDVIIAAFPKSGTHWLWEVTKMLVNKSASYQQVSKEFAMLDFGDLKTLETEASPRILNTHLSIPHLPQGILEKKNKIIHVIRNPKSVMVSFYMFINQMVDKKFTMDSMMRSCIEDLLDNVNQLEYIRQIEAFKKNNPDHPVHTVVYEEMKKNPRKETKRLAEFLGVSNTEEFYEKVAEACGFDNMKKADQERRKPKEMTEELKFKPKFEMYRKGTIGDWKNHLTVAQNEMMDAWIETEFKKGGLDFEFIYE